MFDKHSAGAHLSGILPGKLGVAGRSTMKSAFLYLFLTVAFPAFGQKTRPGLNDGTVIDENAEYRHDGSLSIAGRVKLKGISLDLRGVITVASGADLELEDVHIEDVHINVSDPTASPNCARGLRCEGPAKPEPGASNCPFRLRLNEVNADTWDVYAGAEADLTFPN